MTIDLRSDTVTQPTTAMREAMLRADVGDDVYGEDPTVNALQERLASDLGFEAGLFAPSGTQANLVGLLSHCQRGDEYIVGMDAHTYKFEGGGAAVFGSIQPQPLPQGDDGTMSFEGIEAAIKHAIRISRVPSCCASKTLARARVAAVLSARSAHAMRPARAVAAPGRRTLVQRRGRRWRARARDHQALRQRVGVPVERARRTGGVRAARFAHADR
jgi:hypothetical protein